VLSAKETEPVHLNPHVAAKRAVVTSGVAAAYTSEVMKSLGLWDSLPLYQVLQPFPLHTKFIDLLLSEYEDILVIEETTAVIEMQLADRYRVKGKLNRVVPRVGELLPEKIQQYVANFAGVETKINSLPSVPGRRPTLCAGCLHRASFFAIKKAVRYSRDNGPAVVIARHPCIIDSARRGELIKRADVNVNEDCDGCGFCLQNFECPAMVMDQEVEQMCIDPFVCTSCGVCLNICPRGAIIEKI